MHRVLLMLNKFNGNLVNYYYSTDAHPTILYRQKVLSLAEITS